MDLRGRIKTGASMLGRILGFLAFTLVWELFTGHAAYYQYRDGNIGDAVLGAVFGLVPLLIAVWWLYTRDGAILPSRVARTRG